MKKWLIVVTVIIATLPIYAQRNAMETNTWLLSSAFPRCGIDFSGGRGEGFWSDPWSDSKTVGRTVTISDPGTGKLLFHVGKFVGDVQEVHIFIQSYSGRVLRQVLPYGSVHLDNSRDLDTEFCERYSDVCDT